MGGCMPGARRGGVWYGRPRGGGGMGTRGGGAWAPPHIFVGRGETKKKLLIRKKIYHIEKTVAERPSHGEKGLP